MTTFSSLGLSAPLLKSLDEMGFDIPTTIQAQAIPLLAGEPCDFIGLAQTGTGKTAAFGLPLLQKLDFNLKGIQALILAPTRELALQIGEGGLKSYGKYIKGCKTAVVYGGADISRQIKALKSNVNIVVATPGRLLDLVKRKAMSLQSIKYVVLDEADEMLNMGFKEDLNTILSYMPRDKSTWLFSATMPSAIKNIVHQYMNDPVSVAVDAQTKVNQNISHQYMVMKASNKLEAVKRILDYNNDIYAVMFCRTKMDTSELAQALSKFGYSVDALNGDLTQSQRERVMKRFKSHQIKLLVATDVAARGIDVNDLTHVIHHRLPDELEFYTHRSGRTARAGKKGISLVLATNADVRKLKLFEQKLNIKFEPQSIPNIDIIRENKIITWAKSLISLPVATDISTEEWQKVKNILEDINKDQLVAKLLTIELDKIKQFDTGSDLNVKTGKDELGRNTGSSSYTKFYISIGKIDGATKKELIDFIVEHTGLEPKKIGDVVMEKMGTYFDVHDSASEGIIKAMKGLLVQDREIKVEMIEKASRRRTSNELRIKRRSTGQSYKRRGRKRR